MTVSLSQNAAKRLKVLMDKDPKNPAFFRLAVEGGGCSGFQYIFSFDDKQDEGDFATSTDGVTLLVDDASLPLLDGAEVDYVEELIGASFQVKNPNASSGCGCGTSFSI